MFGSPLLLFWPSGAGARLASAAIADGVVLLLLAAACAYLALAIWRVAQFQLGGTPDPGFRPPITVLMPLCGDEPGLLDRLRSLCRQPYDRLQIVLGTASLGDPVLNLVTRVAKEFPTRDIALVVDPSKHGGNRKVSNLLNMVPHARHGLLLLCDSDVELKGDVLGPFVAPLADPDVGAVTAAYRSLPTGTFGSRLGSLLLNDWFLPGDLITESLGPMAACNGPLVAIRRQTLDAIGGFGAIADDLADDVAMGALIRRLGKRIVLSRVPVNIVVEGRLQPVLRRELRWARTIRATQRIAHFMSLVTFALPLAAVLVALDWSLVPIALLGTAAALRIVLHRLICRRLGITTPAPSWLLMARELACLAVWLASYAGHRIVWRGVDLELRADGKLVREPIPARNALIAGEQSADD